MHCLVFADSLYLHLFGVSVPDFLVILMFLQLVLHFPFHNFPVDAAYPLGSFLAVVCHYWVTQVA